MRLGSFLVGGLFGVVVGCMMNPKMKTGWMSSLGSTISNTMMGNTTQSSSSSSKTNTTSSANPGSTANQASATSANSQTSSNAGSSSSGINIELEGLKKFKQMIAQDPQLKQTIKDIIKQEETASHSAGSNKSSH